MADPQQSSGQELPIMSILVTWRGIFNFPNDLGMVLAFGGLGMIDIDYLTMSTTLTYNKQLF